MMAGRSAFTHQIVQTIPVTSWSDVTGQSGYANETMIELTGTSAAVFMSVYPVSLYSITPDDYDALGRQILGWQSPPANRSVFLRFAPEMQGASRLLLPSSSPSFQFADVCERRR